MSKHALFCVLPVLAIFGACGGSEPAQPEYPPLEEPLPETAAAPEPALEPPAPPTPEPVRVVEGENTPIEGETPSLAIRTPRMGQRIRRGPVQLKIELRNWALAPDPGNHVHVIVDDHDYIAVRDVSTPIDLGALMQEHLGVELAEGTHVVRVFPSRHNHESVKADGAFAWTMFTLGTATEGFSFDGNGPLLTYSRPKGCVQHGARALLDFYLTGATLSADGPKIRYAVMGNNSSATGEITSWRPHYIENLPLGEATVSLELLGTDGQVLPGSSNQARRTIQVQESCTPAVAAPH